jgi:biotin operon repressor
VASNEKIKEDLKKMRESVQKSIDELEEEKHKIMKKMEK